MNKMDERDQQLLEERRKWFTEKDTPMVGDVIRFADGVERRISYKWPETAQTSAGGSFYIDIGVVSFSGGLYPGIPLKTLSLTSETQHGRFWFFHHDTAGAGRGVEVSIPCRVWACTLTGKDPYRPKPLASGEQQVSS